MDRRPVLYLDLDDTVISWRGGSPHAAPGAREFILWALSEFEVRWLTTWCPDGDIEPKLLGDLADMLELPVSSLEHIRGHQWPAEGSKLNGIAWLEHMVHARPFIWLEDDYGFSDRERIFLERHGHLQNYIHCNVTEDPDSLGVAHERIRVWIGGTQGPESLGESRLASQEANRRGP
jgi:hypothetical protein